MTSCGFSGETARSDLQESADLLLAVNAAEERLQLAIGRLNPQDPHNPEFLSCQEWLAPGQVMSHLAPLLQESMARLHRPLNDLALIACVRGPGSFTGLRLTLATTLGLACSLNKPLMGLDYLPLLAREALLASQERVLWILSYARRGQVYIQGFFPGKSGLPEPLAPAQAVLVENAAAIIAKDGRPAALAGSGLRRQPQVFAQLLPGSLILNPALDHPRPQALLAAAAASPMPPALGQPIEPLYLRPSDAEENLAVIAAKRGLSLEAAQKNWIVSVLPEIFSCIFK